MYVKQPHLEWKRENSYRSETCPDQQTNKQKDYTLCVCLFRALQQGWEEADVVLSLHITLLQKGKCTCSTFKNKNKK